MLDVGSSVSSIPKKLYDTLNIDYMEKSIVDLQFVNCSTKHYLGRTNNFMTELHMTFVSDKFIIMDMGSKIPWPIII
jgi:hypothetical protein